MIEHACYFNKGKFEWFSLVPLLHKWLTLNVYLNLIFIWSIISKKEGTRSTLHLLKKIPMSKTNYHRWVFASANGHLGHKFFVIFTRCTKLNYQTHNCIPKIISKWLSSLPSESNLFFSHGNRAAKISSCHAKRSLWEFIRPRTYLCYWWKTLVIIDIQLHLLD